MTVSASRFKKMFPEFDRTNDELCLQRLAVAERSISVGTWGDRADDGIMWLAAHLLSMSPEGQQARLAPDNIMTTYQLTFNRMVREVTAGVGRVI